jgi:sarcosine oxidase subunit alpha
VDRRLPQREGEWIDRSQPIAFRFEGSAYQGFSGDVLSSALWANDVRLLGRSFKYHRPRGIYSLSGHDANVIVEDDRRTNLRGDTLPIDPTLDVRAVNTRGGLERDRLNVMERFSRFLPVGFYYKAFHTPRRLFPFYEKQMRRVAGLGAIRRDSRPTSSPKDYDFCDALVVGGGPAGLSAAIAAAELGLDVLVVDEQPRLGGSLSWRRAPGAASRPQHSELLSQASSHDNIRVRSGTQAAGCYDDLWVALVDEQRLTKLRAKSLVVAAGCIEQPAVFQNNDLPGVMLGSAAQRLMHLYAVKPFDRAVVLAANPDGYQVALDLHESGVEVAAVVDMRRDGESTSVADDVKQLGLTVHRGSCIYEALPVAGKRRIRGAVIAPLGADGGPDPRKTTQLDCDGVVMSVGWAPNGGLLYQSGGRFTYADRVEQLVPESLPPGRFAAGRVNGVFDLAQQLEDGRRAGLAAAAHLGKYNGELPAPLVHSTSPPGHPYPIIDHSGKKNFVDLDEDIHVADFKNAHQEGFDSVELMKRFATVGMGPSQGKLSNSNAVRILAKLNGASVNETGTTTSRPFHQPVSLNHLAGRRFHPHRRTPIHNSHVAAGAVPMHAGSWLRPEYYERTGLSREDCILAEAVNVRDNVGLIDVSTLGKLWVNGPDAAEFLERIYTGRFRKQAVGRSRYAVACDETGVIIEDGVVARLADDRYYVTATSSGAAAFYRELQRWALIWGADVTLTNATGHTAAMNIAGPNSRQVLQQLADVDLSAEAFAYLDVKRGAVADAPALLMRVGFVGELGYEIHTPASAAHHVWNAIVDAGGGVRLQPFGVEAQRLLRLEKGHLIVGQDTDALTNPYEADLAWAIGKNKSFFIGSRSLEIVRDQPLTRRLAGVEFSPDRRELLPEECHLIIADGEMAGRITSIAHQSTLGHPIALAYVRPDLAIAGAEVHVRLTGRGAGCRDAVLRPRRSAQ